MSTTETSEDAYQFSDRRKSRPSGAGEPDHMPVQVAQYQRPVRVRKPAQKDSHIISWSEAVDTIKSLDPDLHAGMRADARHNLDEGSSAFDRHRSSSDQHAQRRRVSDNRQDFRQNNPNCGEGQLFQQSRKRFSDVPVDTRNQESHPLGSPRPIGNDNEAMSITSAPCPHVDCRPYTMKFYNLQRMADEEQSQMSLHLLSIHHTTPFPCGEIGCPQKGEHGFFMQTDLVRHVKSAHPSMGALHRLRGRVDSCLLENNSGLGRSLEFSSNKSNPPDDRPVSQHRGSDFMSLQRPHSNRITSSSRPFSRSSDLDRTLTPRGTTSASTYTPMTSVSSLMVNHPSAKVNSMTGMGNSQERSSMPGGDMHNEEHRDEDASNARYSSGFVDANEDEQQIQWHTAASPELGTVGRNAFDRFPSAPDKQARVNGGGTKMVSHGGRHHELVSPPITQNSSHRSRLSVPTSIPNSQSSADDKPSSSKRSETYGSSAANIRIPSRELNGKNDKGFASKAKATSSMLPPNKPQRRAAGPPPPATPIQRRKARKSVAPNVFELDDADELSLGSDGFVLLSSRRTTKTPFELPVRIKREDTVDIQQTGSAAAARKRKLKDFQGSDEIDELMADEPDFSVSQLGPSSKAPIIKTENEAEAPVAVPTLFKQARAKKQSGRSKKSSLSRSDFPSIPSPSVRASTPLLNLTPNRGQTQVEEIAESDQESSSPLAGLLTPVNNRHLAGAGAGTGVEGPAIVVKTPGGTFRRCGEDGFACRKSFCFRCGSKCTAADG